MTMLESLPIIDVASLILAVFLGYLAVREYVDHRTGKLENELTMVNSALTRERYAFSDRAGPCRCTESRDTSSCTGTDGSSRSERGYSWRTSMPWNRMLR